MRIRDMHRTKLKKFIWKLTTPEGPQKTTGRGCDSLLLSSMMYSSFIDELNK